MAKSKEGDEIINKDVIRAHALENAINHKGMAANGSVLNALFAEGLQKDQIKGIMPLLNEIVEHINSWDIEKQKTEFESIKEKMSKREVRIGLPPLPEAEEGKVVMRIAPFPSGPLHIGNTRQLILNDEYTKMYKGKLLLVMDDTIGSEEKPIEPEMYKLIPESVEWLGVKYDKKIIYKSERLEIYYKYAQEMLEKGYLYVCSCSQDSFHDLKIKGIDCSCRHLPKEEQIKRWKKMFDHKTPPGTFVVRLKTSMQDPDPAFRDRPMFRISDREHAKVKKKYRVWPLLEFSWAIDDHLLGITHIVRGIELMMETQTEKFIWDLFGWFHPQTIHTGLFQIEGVKLSKSKGSKEVRSGEYIGWNDPRLWSLQSLRDRGFRPEAIREFILGMGITKTNSLVAVDVLYALNRRYIENSPRLFFVQDPQRIHITGCPDFSTVIPLHPSENLGDREIKTKQDFFIPLEDAEMMKDANYRLIHLLNFKSTQVSRIKPRDFSFVSKNPDKTLNTKYIQWLPADDDSIDGNVPAEIVMPDGSTVKGLGEKAVSKIKVGETAQFERVGFVRLNKKIKSKEKSNKKSGAGKEIFEFWFAHP